MTYRAILLAAAALLAAPAALAQGAPQSAGGPPRADRETAASGDATAVLEDIVVTARKREESLQDVPVAISAFSSGEIKSARIERLADLAKLTPGLNFVPLFGAQNQLPIIRGAAQTFGALNVGVFLDGVYLSGKASVDIELNDLERIEVVKGPQSALYGRNTFAGAINYITKRPTAEWTGNAEGTIGDLGFRKVQASVSGPLNEFVRVRVGGFYREFDGFYRSSIDGGRVDHSKTYGGILTVEVAPSTDLTMTFRLAASNEDSGQPPSNVIRTNAASGAPFAGAAAALARNLLYIGEVPSIPRNGVTVNTVGPNFVANVPLLPGTPLPGPYGQRQDTIRGSLKIEYDLGGALLTSITAYDKRRTEYTFDGDNTICELATGCPNFGFPFVPAIPTGRSQFALSSNDGRSIDRSQEFRLQSSGQQRLSWLVGAFLYGNRTTGIDRSVAGGAGFPPPNNQGLLVNSGLNSYGFPNQTTRTASEAVFGSLTFQATDALRLTAEARQEWERQSFIQFPANPNAPAFVPPTTNVSSRLFNLRTRFKFFTPRFIVDVRPNEDVLLYASAARGVKTGGINTNISIFDNQRFYGPESTWNFEVGAKTDLLDRRLQLNAAGFYTDWRNQQVACQVPQSQLPGTSTQRTYICNVGKARIYGLELSAVAQLTDIFAITGSYTYTHARYQRFVDDSLADALVRAGLPPYNFDGRRLPYVPDHKLTVSPRLSVPAFADFTFEARADVSYQSKSYVRADNLAFFGDKTVVDLRAGVRSDSISLQAFVNNVFDDATPVAGVRFFDSVNFSVASPLIQGADRRQFGVTLGYRF